MQLKKHLLRLSLSMGFVQFGLSEGRCKERDVGNASGYVAPPLSAPLSFPFRSVFGFPFLQLDARPGSLAWLERGLANADTHKPTPAQLGRQ